MGAVSAYTLYMVVVHLQSINVVSSIDWIQVQD